MPRLSQESTAFGLSVRADRLQVQEEWHDGLMDVQVGDMAARRWGETADL